MTAALLALALLAQGDGNRFTYLDESNPYYPHGKFPKLTTPQWIGEEGVEAAVILAIDDMRGHEKWETYLRPILDRLRKIDGRAPVSIMTCTIDPYHPHLQKWIREGVQIDIHTVDHPCPLLQGGDFAKAKSTVDRCIELVSMIPNHRPVAYRMPCCDSLNTPSPRFYQEIFNKTTPTGKFLTIDTSVFCILTDKDAEGNEKWRKYIPFPSFVNTIEDYPYPYVLGRLCWQFPCIVPSDWSAQHLNKPNSPVTVADLKAILDSVVARQGVFDFVFHPHGWISSDQVIELIDYAVAKHGRKLKFLNFREAQERLDKHLLDGHPIRREDGGDGQMRLLDVNADGYLDVLGWDQTRVWDPAGRRWITTPVPRGLTVWDQLRIGVVRKGGFPTAISPRAGAWTYDGTKWVEDPKLETEEHGAGFRLRDLDGDGLCEMVVGYGPRRGVLAATPGGWEPLPFSLPDGVTLVSQAGHDRGLRFVDLNGDGKDDLVFSNEEGWGVHVFKDLKTGWETVAHGEPGGIPMIARGTTDNGAWFHSKHLWVQNEDTAKMPNLVDRRSFDDLLRRR
jgi:hypothetical protein